MTKRLLHAGAALAVATAIWTPSAASADDVPDCNGAPATIVGTDGPDQIFATSAFDIIASLGGDDTITGPLGGDLVCSGEGDDTVVSPAGLGAFGGPGDDRLEAKGTLRYDTTSLHGDEGDDEIISSGGLAYLHGGTGDDLIKGGNYRDYIYPGLGRDTIDGGAGDTSLIPEHVGYGPVRFNLTKGVGKGQGRDSITSVESVEGTEYDDILIGDNSHNSLNGSIGSGDQGVDVVRGRGGDDFLLVTRGKAFGGAGDDNIRLYLPDEPTSDYFDGGRGVDLINYTYGYETLGPVELDLVNETSVGVIVGNDVAKGFEGAVGSLSGDTFIGDEHDNDFDGGNGRDQIWGGGGSDLLDGGTSFDAIFGDDGDDSLRGGPGTDSLNGGEGVDRCLLGEALTGCENTSHGRHEDG